MSNQPTFYAILTADVRYSEKINANEKLLYAEITAMTNKHGYCWASNEYFSKLYKCTPQAISKWIKNLKNNGFISCEYLYKNGSKEISQRLIKLSNIGINDGLIGINDGLSGINDCLGGYQHTIKDNNTSNNNIYNTSLGGFENHERDSVKSSKETKSQSQLLSKTNRDDLDETTKIYFDIAFGFQRLFIHNKKQLGINNFKDQENATFKSYVEPIRLAIERDGMTRDDFAKIFLFLKEDEFWMKNIMSVSKLRDKMGDLLIKASKLKPKQAKLPEDWFSRELTKEQIELLTEKQKKSWEHNKNVIAIEGGYLKPIIK